MALITDEQANAMLSEGSMIERIGSYLPPVRPGYDMTKIELRVQNSVAKKLYNKRVTLARRMANSPSKDIETVVYSALVSCDISPYSVVNYDRYIQTLVDRQGGWDRWRNQVRDEIDRIDNAKRSIARIMIPIIAALIISMIVGAIGNTMLKDVEYFFMVPAVMTIIVVAYASSIGSRKIKNHKAVITETAGPRTKSPDAFFPHTKVR